MLTAEQIVRILDDAFQYKGSLERPYQDSIDDRRIELVRTGLSNQYAQQQARVEWLEAQMKDWGKE